MLTMNSKVSALKVIRLAIWVIGGLYLFTFLFAYFEQYWLVKQAQPRAVLARGNLADNELSTINIFNTTSPSVVFISTNKIVRNYWTRDIRKVPKGTGSGFIWDEFGHVVTNYHVIKGASEANIRLNDGRTFQARLVGISPNHDLAVLKINVPLNIPPAIPIGLSSNLQVGQSVYAIGNPFGLDHTLTSGIVSALNRSLSADSDLIINNLIQTDAAINPGNSGGPLLDSAGRLIGINTAIYSPSGAYAGIGFAVPVDTVNKVVPQLIVFGKYSRPSLGIFVDESINKQIASELGIDGVIVLEVNSDSANSSKLHAVKVSRFDFVIGDVIQSINQVPVNSVKSLFTELDKYKIGDTVSLSLFSQGENRTVLVVLE